MGIGTVGVLFFSLDGYMSDANAAFERLSGYGREELLSGDWQVLTPPEFVQLGQSAMDRLRRPEP